MAKAARKYIQAIQSPCHLVRVINAGQLKLIVYPVIGRLVTYLWLQGSIFYETSFYKLMKRLAKTLLLIALFSVRCAAQQSTILFFRKDPALPLLVWTRMGIFHNKEKVATIKRNNVAVYHPDQKKVTVFAKILIPSLFARYNKSGDYTIAADDNITFVEMRVRYRILSGVKISYTTLTQDQFKRKYESRKKLRRKLARIDYPTINSLYEINH